MRYKCDDCGADWDSAIYNCPSCGSFKTTSYTEDMRPKQEVIKSVSLDPWLKRIKPYLEGK